MDKKDFIICCDMDDTIEHLVAAWISWLNAKHNLDVKYDDIKDWNISLFYPTLTQSQVFEPLNQDDFWKTVQPMPDAIIYIKKLIDEGFSFYICTASHYNALKTKMEEVLFKYFPYLNWKNVIVTQNKQLIKCDVLVDDGAHNILGDYIGLLKDAPYNKEFDEHAHLSVMRVHDWEEIYNLIHQIYNLARVR